MFLKFPQSMISNPSSICLIKDRKVDDCVFDMGGVLKYISCYCPNVKMMEMTVFELYDSTLIEIAKSLQSFSKLQSLSIKYSYYMGKEKDMNETIDFIFEDECSKLCSIKLNYNSFTNPKIQSKNTK